MKLFLPSSKMQLKRHSCPRNYYQRESPEPSKKPWVKRFLSLWWWLDKWKQRHNVTFKDASGEVNGVTSDMTSSCSETYLPAILSKYELKDIYNAEEFGFFYEALPEKSLHYRDERCGGKHSKRKLIGHAFFRWIKKDNSSFLKWIRLFLICFLIFSWKSNHQSYNYVITNVLLLTILC